VTHEPTVLPAARRLRRLRWLMTIAFTLANIIGLAVLAGVALDVDASSRRQAERAEAEHRVTAVADLVYTVNGRLVLDGLINDDGNEGHPEVYVLAGDRAKVSVVFAGHNRRHDVANTWLDAGARRAISTSSTQVTNARDTHGTPVYLLATPLYAESSMQPFGAVIAVGDPQAGAGAHTRLFWSLLAGIGVLTLGCAAVGHTLSGRGIRPAIASLTQQERILANAAHELRTPVAALRAAAEAALAETVVPGAGPGGSSLRPADDNVSRAELDAVVRHTQRLESVIDALLTRARLAAGVQKPQRETLRLDLLAEDVVADLIDAGMDGTVQVKTDPSVVSADPTLLRLAIRNLVDNAVRHGHRPGERANAQVSVAGGTVMVTDNGPGVPNELLKARFTRYASNAGTGLGLSIVAQIAIEHGGRLDVFNAPEGGAVFTLRLS
jgi:two-component system OmpR family sensor kinase